MRLRREGRGGRKCGKGKRNIYQINQSSLLFMFVCCCCCVVVVVVVVLLLLFFVFLLLFLLFFWGGRDAKGGNNVRSFAPSPRDFVRDERGYKKC